MIGADWLQLFGTAFCFVGFAIDIRRYSPKRTEVLPQPLLHIEVSREGPVTHARANVTYDDRIEILTIAEALNSAAKDALNHVKH